MKIKQTIKAIPFMNDIVFNVKLYREYFYDKKFYLKNFSHSKETKNKIGYNMLLISHSLEKGMSNKNPRRFGIAKIDELTTLIEKYEKYDQYKDDFAYINAINSLRAYVSFYELNEWSDTSEYAKVKSFISVRDKISKMNVGSFILNKADFEQSSKIDFENFLKGRHSIREFLKKPISKKDIKKAVEIASLSPSACNRQMCKVYNIASSDLNKKVINIAQGFGGFEKETINTLVITFDVNANYFIGERNQGWFNAGLFSMNLVNALHSLGIGSCFCQFGNTTKEEEKLKKELNIPKNERIAVIIAAGYYCDSCIIPYSPRKKLEDIYEER